MRGGDPRVAASRNSDRQEQLNVPLAVRPPNIVAVNVPLVLLPASFTRADVEASRLPWST